MTITQTIDAGARKIADDLGRDWIDCGTYERESFRDEARRRLAKIIHNSWSVQPFNPERDSEDWIAADAVIAAFPAILETKQD